MPELEMSKKSVKTPSQLEIPAYLLNFPFTLSTNDPNNVWMEELSEEDRQIDHAKAYAQFLELYNYMASGGIVYILPSEGEYQDQVYVANLGIHLPHIIDRDVIILSNFKSEPRRGEEKVGYKFFKQMGYELAQPPTTFEGEADLKYIRDNIYIGGHGIRSDIKSFKWMAEHFDMEIIPVRMEDDYLYHFDCLLFVLTSEKVMLATELCRKEDVKQLEKYVEIVDVPADMAYNGITNSVRFENIILCASDITSMEKDDEYYEDEKDKVDFLTRLAAREGMEAAFFNLHEFTKSGAMLSCLVFHLNYVDLKKPLI